MGDAARRHAGQLVIIALGPLTNIAVALQHHPDLAANGECHLAYWRALTAHKVFPVCFSKTGHSCMKVCYYLSRALAPACLLTAACLQVT